MRRILYLYGLSALLFSQAYAGQGGTWVMEYLFCMDSAESAGIPREEARMQCGQSLAESGSIVGGDPDMHLTGKGGTWVMEYLLCMENAESAGIPREEARMQCGQSLSESVP